MYSAIFAKRNWLTNCWYNCPITQPYFQDHLWLHPPIKCWSVVCSVVATPNSEVTVYRNTKEYTSTSPQHHETSMSSTWRKCTTVFSYFLMTVSKRTNCGMLYVFVVFWSFITGCDCYSFPTYSIVFLSLFVYFKPSPYHYTNKIYTTEKVSIEKYSSSIPPRKNAFSHQPGLTEVQESLI